LLDQKHNGEYNGEKYNNRNANSQSYHISTHDLFPNFEKIWEEVIATASVVVEFVAAAGKAKDAADIIDESVS